MSLPAPTERAVRAALDGMLVVLPTDTVYGIGTRPDLPESTARLFAVKGRSREYPLPVLVPSLDSARSVGEFDDRAEALTRAHWPGPLTLVLPRSAESRGWDLGMDQATVAVRMPRHPLALAVLECTGPLAVTSANRSGDPTPATCDRVREIFGEAVEVYLCDERPLGGSPSAVVDVTRAEPAIIRSGDLDADDMRRLLELGPS